MFWSVVLWEDGTQEGKTFFHSECLGSILKENSYWLSRQEENGFESACVSFRLGQLINVFLIAENICPQSTQLVSILYLCYGFSSHAYLLYDFSGYAILRYAYLRFGFSRYTYLRYAYLRYAFSRYAYLRYAFTRYAFLQPETGFCPSASVWCICDLEHRIGLLLFSFGLMHDQFG